MKSLAKIVGAAVLAASIGAVASAALEGGYVSPGGGTVEFAADGVFKVAVPVGTFEEAYAVEGDTLTITSAADAPHDCKGMVGVYTFVESDEGVTFTLVSDDCQTRKDDLTSGLWTKAPAAE